MFLVRNKLFLLSSMPFLEIKKKRISICKRKEISFRKQLILLVLVFLQESQKKQRYTKNKTIVSKMLVKDTESFFLSKNLIYLEYRKRGIL